MATEPPAGCYLGANLTDKGTQTVQKCSCEVVSLKFFPVTVPESCDKGMYVGGANTALGCYEMNPLPTHQFSS